MTKTTTDSKKSGGLSDYYNLSHRNNAKRKFAGVKAIVITISLLIILVGIPLIISYAKYKSEADMISLPELEISDTHTKRPRDYGYEYDEGDYRVVVSGDEISTYTRQATVAAEDRNFYDYDRTKLSRKLLYFSNSFSNDVGELEKMYTRDEILTMYLNEAPYVKEIKGINIAAHTYFSKSAKDLNLAEAAFLAAIPSGSKLLDPANDDDRAALLERQHEILDTMAKMGYITSSEAETAKTVDVLDYINKPKSQSTSQGR